MPFDSEWVALDSTTYVALEAVIAVQRQEDGVAVLLTGHELCVPHCTVEDMIARLRDAYTRREAARQARARQIVEEVRNGC